MRQCIDHLRRKGSPIAVLLGSTEADKVTLVAGISRELEERGLSAGTWIKDAATIVGGKGAAGPTSPRPAASSSTNCRKP
jgi:alanyl-tRNA synthetase